LTEEPSSVIINENIKLLITPNPASDFVEIDFGNVILSEAKNPVRIFDIFGIEYTTLSLRDTPPYQGGEIMRFNVSHLSPGIYFVRSGNNIQKFIKY
jgi:hypothetical protein